LLLATPILGRIGESLALEAAAPAGDQTQFAARDIRVLDGDTIEVLSTGERIRMVNIDAAELGAGAACAAEARHALAAKHELRLLVRRAQRVTVSRAGSDAYGRTLAAVAVDGRDAGAALIAADVARPWQGRRREWCSARGALLR
jgi:endonuclease YncB( thermonuclease family)